MVLVEHALVLLRTDDHLDRMIDFLGLIRNEPEYPQHQLAPTDARNIGTSEDKIPVFLQYTVPFDDSALEILE